MARSGFHKRNGTEEVVIALGEGSVNFGSLAKTINESLQAVGIQVSEDMQSVFDEVGKEAVEKLRETSPKNPKGKYSGRYAKGWIYEKGKKRAGSNYKAAGVIRNKTDPQLTHILEYGHPLIRNGKVVGNVEPIEHINPVATWASETIEEKLLNKLERG